MQAPKPPATSLGKPAFEHYHALWEKVLYLHFTFLKALLYAAIENPPQVRSGAVLNKEEI